MDPVVDNLIQWKKIATGLYVDELSYRQVNVNEAIAGAQRFAAHARADSEGDPHSPLGRQATDYTNMASLLVWFRDSKQVNSIGEMFDLVASREIPIAVIDLWVDEFFDDGMPGCQLYGVIHEAYPEFARKMEERTMARMQESLSNTRRMIDEM